MVYKGPTDTFAVTMETVTVVPARSFAAAMATGSASRGPDGLVTMASGLIRI